jgi:small multidrug resistance family-3 protein
MVSGGDVVRAVGLFALAGVAEIGGGYLMWRWLRADAAIWVGVVGAMVIVLYGVIPTLQDESSFGRVYAAYGGVFVVLSLLWGWWLDGVRPDRYDVLGAVIVSVGVGVIFFAPRQ